MLFQDALADVFEQDEQMQRVAWRGSEIELFIIASGLIVFGMNCQGTDSGNVSSLQGPQNCIFQQSASNSPPLPVLMHSQTRKQHDRNGVPRQPFLKTFGSICIFHLTYRQTVVTGNYAVHKADVSLRSTCILILLSIFQKPVVEGRLSAIKSFERMIAPKLLNATYFLQRFVPASKNPGVFRSALSFGKGRTGASRAA